MELIDFLPHEKENAINGADLIKYLGLNSTMDLRKEVKFLRAKGIPICSTSQDYWYSEKPEDILLTIHQLEHRMEEIANATEGLYHFMIERGFKND